MRGNLFEVPIIIAMFLWSTLFVVGKVWPVSQIHILPSSYCILVQNRFQSNTCCKFFFWCLTCEGFEDHIQDLRIKRDTISHPLHHDYHSIVGTDLVRALTKYNGILSEVCVDVTDIDVPGCMGYCKHLGGHLQNRNCWDFPWSSCKHCCPGTACVRSAQDRAAVRILQVLGTCEMSADAATYQ